MAQSTAFRADAVVRKTIKHKKEKKTTLSKQTMEVFKIVKDKYEGEEEGDQKNRQFRVTTAGEDEDAEPDKLALLNNGYFKRLFPDVIE
jgi:hypothetical protein